MPSLRASGVLSERGLRMMTTILVRAATSRREPPQRAASRRPPSFSDRPTCSLRDVRPGRTRRLVARPGTSLTARLGSLACAPRSIDARSRGSRHWHRARTSQDAKRIASSALPSDRTNGRTEPVAALDSLVPIWQRRRRHGRRGSNDWLMVDHLVRLHAALFRADGLRLGPSWLGFSLPEVRSTAPRASGRRHGRFRNVQPSVLGVGRRLRVDRVCRLMLLACLGLLASLMRE
jgi:hypothetical protein